MAFAAEKGVGYWTAASAVLRDQALAEREMPPFKPEESNVEVDGERAKLHRRATDAARRLKTGYIDAVGIVQVENELAEAEADTGRGDVRWLDTSTAPAAAAVRAAVA